MYDCRDPSVNLSLIIISHAVEWVNCIEGGRVGGLMLFMELWIGYTHSIHTHTDIPLFSSLSPPELNNRRRLIEQSSRVGTHSIIFKWNKSHFSLILAFPLSLSFSVSILHHVIGLSLVLFISLFCFFLSFPPNLYIFSLFLFSLSSSLLLFPLSVDQVIPSASSSGQTRWPSAS